MDYLIPSHEEWKKLYGAAALFRNLRPWEWMEDRHLFGVQNPVTGEISYCCVLGAAGEVFALAVYIGSEGLNGYMKITTGKVKEGPEMLETQNCLMASFEDRAALDTPDLKVMKELGKKFRGSHAWPQFRSYRPGYYPWILDKDEAAFLTLALEQAIDVVVRFRDDQTFLRPRGDALLVRVHKKEGSTLVWKNEWQTPEPPAPRSILIEPLDTERVEAVARKNLPRLGTWEIDYRYEQKPVRDKDGGRPYLPVMLLAVHRESRFIIQAHLGRKNLNDLRDKVIQGMEQSGTIPEAIAVVKDELAAVLEPLAQQLGIALITNERFKAVPQIRRYMSQFFGRRR